MKRTAALWILLTCLACAAWAAAEEARTTALPDIGVQAAFPEGWTVVTPDAVQKAHLKYLDGKTVEDCAENLRAEGVHAVAIAPGGEALLRVIVREGDETADLYHDIDRYTAALRNEISAAFLDKDAWAVTGYRYTEANWTNKEGQGRILYLTYTLRFGEETVARGRQAYTIRNGQEYILDLYVRGRKPSAEEEKAFARCVANSTLPQSLDFPLLPVGLTLTGILPEETYRAKVTVRGETTKGATVSAWILQDDGDAINVGQVLAKSSTFKLEMELPWEGEWRLYLKSELEGYATSEEARWISYDSRRLPVTFTSYPEGTVTDSQIIISGTTTSGVTIQCMEGDTNKKIRTGSDGSFSFKLDRTMVGDRHVVVSFDKEGFNNRRFDIKFNRQWAREDYAKYLSGKVESLSYANLTERPEKYLGRLVAYSGTVLDVSAAGDRVYVQLGIKKDKEGNWLERIIAVTDEMEVLLAENDAATLYIQVTGEFYAFSDVTSDGDMVSIDLPSVKLLTYDK